MFINSLCFITNWFALITPVESSIKSQSEAFVLMHIYLIQTYLIKNPKVTDIAMWYFRHNGVINLTELE